MMKIIDMGAPVPKLCSMIWVLGILIFICLLLLWLLLAPFQLEIDSRKPGAALKWVSIGHAAIWYDEEWWLEFQVLFFHKKVRMASMKARPKKIASGRVKKPKRRPKGLFKKMIRVLRTFRVKEWQLAIDTGDHALTARLYPLNFFGRLRNHLLVNFTDENFLYIRLRNRPLKILYAYFR